MLLRMMRLVLLVRLLCWVFFGGFFFVRWRNSWDNDGGCRVFVVLL